MLLTPYRRTVQALLHGIPALRKPFLRRSLRPDALLTTDLPRLTAPESLAWLIAALEAQGWTALRQGDYLELTPGLVPPAPGGQADDSQSPRPHRAGKRPGPIPQTSARPGEAPRLAPRGAPRPFRAQNRPLARRGADFLRLFAQK